MAEKKVDEFYGRDREFEVKHISAIAKQVARTLPEKEREEFENASCHVDMACYNLARNLFKQLILAPREEYTRLVSEMKDKLAYAFACEIGDDYTPRHPVLDFKEDFDLLDDIFKELSNEFSVDKKYC